MSFAIIGLLGPANSGKDTIADWFVREHNFVKIAFADPIKRFAHQVFGFTEEQLWGPSQLRNAPVPAGDEFWNQARTRFGKVMGRFLTDLFPEDPGNPLSLRVRGLQWLVRWLAVMEQVSRKGMEDTLDKGTMTPRLVLQTLGTEWGRKLDQDVWARYLYEKVVPQIQDGRWYSRVLGPAGANIREAAEQAQEPHQGPLYNGIVINDVRFRNEAALTKAHGGDVWKLERTDHPLGVVGIPGHASEVEQQEIEPELYDPFICPEGIDLLHEKLVAFWREFAP